MPTKTPTRTRNHVRNLLPLIFVIFLAACDKPPTVKPGSAAAQFPSVFWARTALGFPKVPTQPGVPNEVAKDPTPPVVTNCPVGYSGGLGCCVYKPELSAAQNLANMALYCDSLSTCPGPVPAGQQRVPDSWLPWTMPVHCIPESGQDDCDGAGNEVLITLEPGRGADGNYNWSCAIPVAANETSPRDTTFAFLENLYDLAIPAAHAEPTPIPVANPTVVDSVFSGKLLLVKPSGSPHPSATPKPFKLPNNSNSTQFTYTWPSTSSSAPARQVENGGMFVEAPLKCVCQVTVQPPTCAALGFPDLVPSQRAQTEANFPGVNCQRDLQLNKDSYGASITASQYNSTTGVVNSSWAYRTNNDPTYGYYQNFNAILNPANTWNNCPAGATDKWKAGCGNGQYSFQCTLPGTYKEGNVCNSSNSTYRKLMEKNNITGSSRTSGTGPALWANWQMTANGHLSNNQGALDIPNNSTGGLWGAATKNSTGKGCAQVCEKVKTNNSTEQNTCMGYLTKNHIACAPATVNLVATGTNVTLSPASGVSQSIPYNSQKTYVVTANAGYVVSSTVGGTCPAGSWNGPNYTTGNVISNCTVSFGADSQPDVAVSVSGANISFSPGTSQSIAVGSAASFDLTAASGFNLAQSVVSTCGNGAWSNIVAAPNGGYSSARYSTPPVTGACSIQFTANGNTFSVVASGSLSGGFPTVLIQSTNPQIVNYNSAVSFAVSAQVGFNLLSTVSNSCGGGSWSNLTSTSGTYTTGPITEDCSLVFTGNINTYTVIPSGAGVAATPSNGVSVAHGGSASFSVLPASGHTLSQSVDGNCPSGSWSGQNYTIHNITSNCSVIFSAPINNYWVSWNSWNLTVNGSDQSGSVNVTHSSQAAFEVSMGPEFTFPVNVSDSCCPAGTSTCYGTWSNLTSTSGTYTTNSVIDNCGVHFSPSVHRLVVTGSGNNVQIDGASPPVAFTINYGDRKTFNVSSTDPNMMLVSDVIDSCGSGGEWLSESQYSTGAIDHACSVIFQTLERPSCTVAYSNGGVLLESLSGIEDTLNTADGSWSTGNTVLGVQIQSTRYLHASIRPWIQKTDIQPIYAAGPGAIENYCDNGTSAHCGSGGIEDASMGASIDAWLKGLLPGSQWDAIPVTDASSYIRINNVTSSQTKYGREIQSVKYGVKDQNGNTYYCTGAFSVESVDQNGG